MNTQQEILTIAIPTYNRSRFLEQLLNSLAPQVRGEARVELIVSDNASTDDTQEVIMRFQQQGLQFIASRNEVNIGGDANIHRCFELANSKYVWIIGDDDVVGPNAISKVLTYLTQADYDIVYLRSKSYEHHYVPEQTENHRAPIVVTNAQDFARLVNVWFTFISGNIVNKQRAIALQEKPFSEFVGTTIVQLSWVLTLMSSFRKGLFIFESLVAAKADNTGNYSVCRVFGVTLKDVTEQLLSDRKVSKPIIDSSITNTLPRILMTLRFKSHTFHSEDPEEVLRPSISGNFHYWIFCYPLLHLPRPLAWGWYYACRIVSKFERFFLLQPYSPLLRRARSLESL